MHTTLCPRCQGNVEVVYDYASLRGRLDPARLTQDPERNIWRYLPLLPLDPEFPRPPLALGWTPLLSAERLGQELGVPRLLLKDEGRNPSGSLKDRASAVVLCAAGQAGADTVVGASTGNAGSSMACLSASTGHRCVIFIPAQAPQAKVAQLLAFGAQVMPVQGNYDQAFDLSLEVGQHFNWYSRSTGYNPLTREGKKTCALEIWEQLGHRLPHWVFVSVGDGNIISGLHKGFRDLLALGLTDRLPRLAAIQARGSAAVARTVAALGAGSITPPEEINIQPVSADTCADSISVNLPRDGVAAVRAVQESGGAALQVSDQEILEAIPLTAGLSGVFGEPAGVTAVAGLRAAQSRSLVRPDETVVCVITGSGLKDVGSAIKACDLPDPIEPTLEAFRVRIQ